LKPKEYLLYVFISNLKFYFFLKFEATTSLTQGGHEKECNELFKWLNFSKILITGGTGSFGNTFVPLTEGVADNSSRDVPGLNFIPSRVESLRSLGCRLRIPHVGWNDVTSCTTTGGLFDGIPNSTDFYFVHSYGFVPDDPAHVLATVFYGIPVTASVKCGNIWGTQFHPEKSSQAGFRLLRNFIENPTC